MIDLTSIETSARGVENSEVFALSLCLERLIIGRFSESSHFIKSQFYNPTSMQNVSITKLFELWVIYKDVCSIARIGESANANFYQIGIRYAAFLTNIYRNTTAEQKNIAVVQKSC
jgi:hypothetical protein